MISRRAVNLKYLGDGFFRQRGAVTERLYQASKLKPHMLVNSLDVDAFLAQTENDMPVFSLVDRNGAEVVADQNNPEITDSI